MSQKRIIYLIISVAVIFLIFNPFSGGRVKIKGLGQAEQLALYTQIMDHYSPPDEYLLSLFDSHDIVLIGEHQKLATQVKFVNSLIPLLNKKGIKYLGFEYANASDQDLIDDILTADEYDENKVQEVLFNYLVIWGFQEYADLFRTAWEVNKTRGPGEKPFRIIGLNVERNWSAIKTQEDIDNAEVRSQVIANGFPEVVMARVIMEQVVLNSEKAAVLCNFQSSFTEFQFKGYVENARKQKLPSTLRFGNILYEEIGDRAITVFLHGPWADKSSRNGISYPFNGAIDKLIHSLPVDKQKFGLTINETSFSSLKVTGSFSEGYSSLTLGDMAQGYVALGELGNYETVTPIPDFINDNNIEKAIENFPGPDPGEVTTSEFNQYITNIANDYARALKKLR